MAENSPAFILACVFVAVTSFLAWLGYKLLVPVWGITAGSIAAQYPAMVGDDPTYVAAFNTIVSQENILVQYSFVAIALGIMTFMLVFVYRRHYTSIGIGEEEF